MMARACILLLLFWQCLPLSASDNNNWYQPLRHAFVAGSGVPAIAVVDVVAGRQIDTIRLPIPARVFAASLGSPHLAFSDKIAHDLYVIDLQTHQQRKYALPSPAYRIVFIPKTHKMLVVLLKNIAVLDYQSGDLQVIKGDFQHLYTRFNTIFNVQTQTVWVTQEKTPLIYRYRLNKPDDGWATIDLGQARGLGAGAPSFGNQVIAVNTYYADEGMIYFNDSGRVIRTGKMYNSRPLDEPMVEPYIDNSLHHVVFGDKRGHIKIYDIAQHTPPTELQISFPPKLFRSGWLDQYLIIGGDQHLGIYPFDNPKNSTIINFAYEENIADLWVGGDSKLLLFGTTRSRQLGRFDLQRQHRLADIPLSGIAEIGKIRMNSTNTICY